MMDNGNFNERKNLGEGSEQSTPITARDAWHKKLYGRCDAEAAEASGTLGGSQTVYYGKTPRKWSGGKKALLLFGCILAGVLLLGCITAAFRGVNPDHERGDISGASGVRGSHIGVLYIEGTISEDSGTYSHQYALDAVDGMMNNKSNKALMLFVNTPGGGVYESDELYLKIKEYQEYTERPVYAYFASQATSGGYYVSSSADKIIANRNCWTGSIGVTIGTLYDISGLLQKYGIKTETITSGANKAMGDNTVPMSDQQRNIFQSLVDESYDQFVSVVAQGRNLDTDYVKTIADGRIYTAKQAESNKLIDDIVGTYDEAVEEMIYDCGLVGCDIYEFRYQPQQSLFSGFVESVDKFTEALSGNSDINAITDFLNDSNQLPLQYMCEEIK